MIRTFSVTVIAVLAVLSPCVRGQTIEERLERLEAENRRIIDPLEKS